MRQHRGEILESVIRRSGYSIKALAERLGVSRNTIYNKFREHDLSYDFMVKVGDVIHYDFTIDCPEIKTTVSLDKDQHAVELWRLEKKYTRLLERYNRLLSFLIKIANDYHLERLKKDIDKFLEIPR
ncbi:MAG: helix-turn-helix domain-containing protein [Roseivirga sp.]